jgi:hypothetical protein
MMAGGCPAGPSTGAADAAAGTISAMADPAMPAAASFAPVAPVHAAPFLMITL